MTTNNNIILIGFMGSGKSLIAKHLSARLHREVVETDKLIVELEKRPISEIFQKDGEAYFRKVEKQVVARASKMQNVIIDCGGGVVLDKENVANLKSGGILFFLSASPEEIFQRVKEEGHRPLLEVKDPKGRIKELLLARMPFYEQAHFTIDTDGKTAEQICGQIMEKMTK